MINFKQIIPTQEVQPEDIIQLHKALHFEACNSNVVIAYVTYNGTGLAILCKNIPIDGWGFLYHKHLITRRNLTDFKYSGGSRREAIQNVLDAGRKVLLFESATDFIKYAANHSKL